MSDRPRIFLTRELPPESMKRLQQASDLQFNAEDRVLEKQEIIDGARDADGLLCLLTDTIDAEVMDALPQLKVIANFAVGFNNIDVDAATQRSIPVTNTPGVLTDSTADMALALMLASGRRVVEGDRMVRSQSWKGWGPLQLLGLDISGATLGIVGMGRIGQAVARRAAGFDMRVIYWSRSKLDAAVEQECNATYASLDDVLAESDFLSLHVALTNETTHLIGREELARLKPTARIINTARGPVIDEKALVDWLKANPHGGAGLDVYEREPQLEPELDSLENAVVAPHLGSATIGTRTKMGNMAVANCLAACRGERPPNLVNPEFDR